MDVYARNNIQIVGRGSVPMMLAHGFGCDQHMWRHVVPAFTETHRVILFDHVGAGKSDLSAYNRRKYGKLAGYADDVLEICDRLDLSDVVFVGHSVSAMVGVLAANRDPGRFKALVMVGPSPCYLDDESYVGGFSRQDVDALLASMASNYLGWSSAMAPVIMGNPDRPALSEELTNSFCRTAPDIAEHFASVTFLSDNRTDLPAVSVPTLVLQCAQDVIAPTPVGEYVHRQIRGSVLRYLKATGHCPHLSAPDETVEAIAHFLGTLP